MTMSATTAPNLHIDAANGVTYRYRRFGNPTDSGAPLVFLQHYRGTLDNWDPLLIDTIAAQREVILVDNAGVAGSTGTTPDTVEEMARDALAFLDAVGATRYDLIGFSLGGFIAQEIALRRPWLATRDAQLTAICTWGIPEQPTAAPRRHPSARADRQRRP
jgi:pimeloyl-ACP methyl ester carboxylesterase